MKFFEKQMWHLIALILLIVSTLKIVKTDPGILAGSLWGIDTRTWLGIALAIPILHQIYVLVCWRLELHYNYLTNLLGPHSFKFYKFNLNI